jgi:hypothetical protein
MSVTPVFCRTNPWSLFECASKPAPYRVKVEGAPPALSPGSYMAIGLLFTAPNHAPAFTLIISSHPPLIPSPNVSQRLNSHVPAPVITY